MIRGYSQAGPLVERCQGTLARHWVAAEMRAGTAYADRPRCRIRSRTVRTKNAPSRGGRNSPEQQE
jgi:hypothetical protein